MHTRTYRKKGVDLSPNKFVYTHTSPSPAIYLPAPTNVRVSRVENERQKLTYNITLLNSCTPRFPPEKETSSPVETVSLAIY